MQPAAVKSCGSIIRKKKKSIGCTAYIAPDRETPTPYYDVVVAGFGAQLLWKGIAISQFSSAKLSGKQRSLEMYHGTDAQVPPPRTKELASTQKLKFQRVLWLHKRLNFKHPAHPTHFRRRSEATGQAEHSCVAQSSHFSVLLPHHPWHPN